MGRLALVIALVLGVCWVAAGQQQPNPDQATQTQSPPPNQPPPRSDQARPDQNQNKDRETEAGESSSRDTRIDVSPPKDDVKNHPGAGSAADAEPDTTSDVQEMHPWNPYRAMKDEEVGDYYFKRKSYAAALARYQDALDWKENDAVANFRMAECLEKLDRPAEAIPHYQEYLRILPEGPLSKDAKKALEKLGAAEKRETSQKTPGR
jgi:tetratricopeptide (TPR) repeat protein